MVFDNLSEDEFVAVFALGLILAFLIPYVLYCLTIYRLFQLIAPQNRKMAPAAAWRLFIPLYGIVWHFFMVSHIADSVALEFPRRGLSLNDQRPGYKVGLWMCILRVAGAVISAASIGWLVVWIIYWTKVAGFKRMLQQTGPWEQFAHVDAYWQSQQFHQQQQAWQQPFPGQNFGQQASQQQAWQNPDQQQNWPPPQQNPTPANPSDHSRFMPPGS
ncbi:MAG: hypothetical protein ACRC3B_00570 [Bacteroidia bacterium]